MYTFVKQINADGRLLNGIHINIEIERTFSSKKYNERNIEWEKRIQEGKPNSLDKSETM